MAEPINVVPFSTAAEAAFLVVSTVDWTVLDTLSNKIIKFDYISWTSELFLTVGLFNICENYLWLCQ